MTTLIARTAVAAPMSIRCPRCGTEMTTHVRSGIVLDQCRDCRGFFLDHGELERLVAAEGGAWLGPAQPSPQALVTDPRTPQPHRAPAGKPHPVPPRLARQTPRYHSEWSVDDRDAGDWPSVPRT